jgi:hypothetical protein
MVLWFMSFTQLVLLSFVSNLFLLIGDTEITFEARYGGTTFDSSTRETEAGGLRV